jgi:hypothetical protein
MKEPYGEGLASHAGPESCAGTRKGAGEALTGVHTGQPLSCEINRSRMPTLLIGAEGNTEHGVRRESCEGSAQSKTLSMCENSLHGNREIPEIPAQVGGTGRPEKAECRTSGMDVSGKSDGCVVPEKPTNKGKSPAEMVEERQPTKGNTSLAAVAQTLSWFATSFCLRGVRRAYVGPWTLFMCPPVLLRYYPR